MKKYLITFRTFGTARLNGGYTRTMIIDCDPVTWWQNKANWNAGDSTIEGCVMLLIHEIPQGLPANG